MNNHIKLIITHFHPSLPSYQLSENMLMITVRICFVVRVMYLKRVRHYACDLNILQVTFLYNVYKQFFDFRVVTARRSHASAVLGIVFLSFRHTRVL